MNIEKKIVEVAIDINRLKKDAKLMVLSSFIIGIALGLYYTVYQFYLISVGYDGTILGIVFMISNVTSSILMIPGGLIADNYGRKKTYIIGTLLGIPSIIMVIFSTYFPIVLLSSIIVGVSYAFSWPIFSALFADTLDRNEMDFGFSVIALFQSLSYAIGNVLGWIPNILNTKFNYTLIDSYKFALALIAIFIFLMF